MQHILFTGAGGYIGSHTAYYFLKSFPKCRVSIVDNLCSGFIENIDFLRLNFSDRVEFINFDLCDSVALESLFASNKFDCVVHFAASLIVPESVINPILYYQNNVANSLSLISFCIKFGVKKFIFSSTAAVYGEPQKVPVKESFALEPINPYGTSKMMIEMILRDCAIAHDFNYVSLRYFNVAGALSENDYKSGNVLGQRSKNATHLFKVACECAVGKRESISIFGDNYDTNDGSCVRDYIHIDDLSNAHISAFEFLEKDEKSEIFNVGYNIGYSVKEVIECVKKISGVDFKVNQVGRRDGDATILIADNSKILALTSWKPRFNDIEFIAKSAYQWEQYLR